MTRSEWNSARSDFNHAWLKNRFIPALAKARQVNRGAVKDPTTWIDLSFTLREWSARRVDVTAILYTYLSVLRFEIDTPPAALESEKIVVRWLADQSYRSIIVSERPYERLSAAHASIRRVDDCVRCVEDLLNSADIDLTGTALSYALTQLCAAVRELGDIVGSLAIGA